MINQSWTLFFLENKHLFQRCVDTIEKRKKRISPLKIYPENIFEIFDTLAPEQIRKIIILPSPYFFNNRASIPVKSRKITKALINMQKVFDITTNNFDNLWKRGVFIYNISLTEEEESQYKISHEIMWSKIFERFLEHMSSKYSNIEFIFTGTTSRYRDFIDVANGHRIAEVPSINNDDFHIKLAKLMK